MGTPHRRFSAQYRREAAHLVIDTGRSVAAVAAEIQLSRQLLHRWVAEERLRLERSSTPLSTDEREELERLREEVVHLRMDRDFLKKAAAFFAGDSRSNPSGRSR